MVLICGERFRKKSIDPLAELLRNGARDLIRQAVEAELGQMLSEDADLKLTDGRAAVVRNAYLREKTIQAGIGDVIVKMPEARDRRALDSYPYNKPH